MNNELTDKLVQDFPDLYSGYHEPARVSCMYFGFECGDGWFQLLYQLSKDLTELGGVTATQVKEKYGTLRFYYNIAGPCLDTNAVDKLVDKAEDLSGETCETCGKPGKLRGQFWVYTSCEEHLRDN